jgi:hypothetical protein
MPHVDDGLLHAYLDGELAGAARDHVLGHLAECGACRARLEEERALVARAGELLARAAPPRRAPAAFAPLARSHALRWRIPAAWAATVTIAFAVGWYAQGERLAHELAGRPATELAARAPLDTLPRAPAAGAKTVPARSLSRPRGPTAPPPAEPFRRDGDRQLVPNAAAMPSAAEPRALPDEIAEGRALDVDAARAVLGRAPALVPGYAVRRIARSPTEDGVVLIEQEWQPGIVLRLHERRALSSETVDAIPPSSKVARARAVPSTNMAPRREGLARYVGSLRIEIAGPLPTDSLSRILELVQ